MKSNSLLSPRTHHRPQTTLFVFLLSNFISRLSHRPCLPFSLSSLSLPLVHNHPFFIQPVLPQFPLVWSPLLSLCSVCFPFPALSILFVLLYPFALSSVPPLHALTPSHLHAFFLSSLLSSGSANTFFLKERTFVNCGLLRLQIYYIREYRSVCVMWLPHLYLTGVIL